MLYEAVMNVLVSDLQQQGEKLISFSPRSSTLKSLPPWHQGHSSYVLLPANAWM